MFTVFTSVLVFLNHFVVKSLSHSIYQVINYAHWWLLRLINRIEKSLYISKIIHLHRLTNKMIVCNYEDIDD